MLGPERLVGDIFNDIHSFADIFVCKLRGNNTECQKPSETGASAKWYYNKRALYADTVFKAL